MLNNKIIHFLKSRGIKTPSGKQLILAIIFLLFISTTSAYSFDVHVTPIKDHISIDEKAIFNVTIINLLDTEEEFRIRNFDYPIWDINTRPISNPIVVSIKPKSNSTIQIFVNSLQSIMTPVGTYSVNARVDLDSKKENFDIPLTVAIKSTEALIGGYIPNIKTAIDVPAQISPKEALIVKISLKNLNPISYFNLTVRVSSKFINKELYTNLSPPGEGTITAVDSEKIFTIEQKLEPLLNHQQDKIYVDVFFGKRKIDSQFAEYEIMEYLDKQEHTEKLLLKSKKTIKAVSNNPNYGGSLKSETSLFKNLFTSTNPPAELVKEGDKYFYAWQIDFDGKTNLEVSITENYRPLVIIAAFIAALIVIYFLFRSPLVVNKGVTHIGRMEGGISDLKVVIKVKNRSKKQLSDIEVSDTIPIIAEVEKDLSIGSMQPAKLLRHHKGVIIKWSIETLDGGDERVLSYKFKSRLAILGEFSLPSANAKCRYGNRHVISNSNRAIVSSHY